MANLTEDEFLNPKKKNLTEQEFVDSGKVSEKSASASDYLKAAAAGANDAFLTAPGQLLKFTGEDRLGSALVEAGQSGGQYWHDQMTPAAQQALKNPFITPEGFGPTPLQTAALSVAQSVPGTAAMALPGLGATRVLQAARVPGRVALALGGGSLARKTARLATSGLGFGASEGVFSGLSNAAQSGQEVRSKPLDELRSSSPEFRDIEASTDPSLAPGQREQAAREELANRVERQVGLRTALSTGAISALTGGGALGMLERPSASTIKGIGKGWLTEAIQETPQSYFEQRIQDTAGQRAGITPQPGSTLNAAVLGGVSGGILGGVVGGAGALARPRQLVAPAPAETPSEPSPAEPLGLQSPEQFARNWATLPDGQIVPRDQWVGAPDGTVSRPGEIEAMAAQAEAAGRPEDATQIRARSMGLGAQPAVPLGPVTRAMLALPSPRIPAEQALEASPRGVVSRPGEMGQALAQTDDIAERARLLGLGAQPAGQTTAAAPVGQPSLILRTDGTPFKTEQSARTAITNRRLANHQIVPVEGGFAIAPQVSANLTPTQETQNAQAVRGDQAKPAGPGLAVERGRIPSGGDLQFRQEAGPKAGDGQAQGVAPAKVAPSGRRQNIAERQQSGLRVRGGRPPNLVSLPGQPSPAAPAQRGRRLQPFTDNRLSDPEARSTLQAMSNAAGWAEIGGLMTRDSEGNVGRTKWVPRSDWFGDIQADKGSKLTGNLKGVATRVAVQKALSGEPMTEAQKRHVIAMLEWKSQEQLDYEAQHTGSIDPFTLLMATDDVGIDHGESLSDEALAARALEIDEEAVNRAMAASEYESEFLDEMRRIVDGEAQRKGQNQAVGRGSESVPGKEASPAAGPASQEGFSLTGETEAQRVAEEARKKAEKAAQDKADAKAEERAMADREAKNFELGAPTNQSDLQDQEVRQKADAAEAKAKAEEAAEKPAPSESSAQDDRFYYTNGLLGMTSSGSFTKDKSRWATFPKEEANSFDERNLKPAYATQRGIFTGVTTGRKLASNPKPVTPQIKESSRPNEDSENERNASAVQGYEGVARSVSEPDKDGARQFDLFAEPGESKRQAYADLYGTVVKAKTVSYIKASVDHISSDSDLASLLASIRKDAQESLYAVVTDKGGKILRVMRHTKGLKAGSSVSPVTIISEAAGIPGASKIYMAHNHPSGNPRPSLDDVKITDFVERSLNGTGMSIGGHVVIGKSTWAPVGGNSSFEFKPGLRTKSIPITERTMTKRDTLGEALVSPEITRRFVAGLDNAIVLLNQKHYPVGIVNMTADEMTNLRGNSGEGAKRILSALDKSNAYAMIVKTSDLPSAKNITNFVRHFNESSEFKLLDWINGEGVSAAESGRLDFFETAPYFSGTKEGAAGPTINVDGIERPTTNSEGQQGEHTVASVTSDIEDKLGKGALAKIADHFMIVEDMAALKADMVKRGSKFVELVASKEDFLTKGIYDPSTDTSYIVAGNLKAEDSPYGVFIHEVGEHYGLEKMLGPKAYRGVLNQAQMILRAGGKSMREAAVRVNASEDVGLDPDAKNFHRLFADKMVGNKRLSREVIAYLADNPKNHDMPFMRRIMVAVREFMRKLGFTKTLTTDDIVSLIKTAARRSGEFSRRGGQSEALRSANAPEWYSQMARVLSTDKLPNVGTAESMLQRIEGREVGGKMTGGLLGNGDIKAEEYAQSGIRKFLSQQTGTVTKQEILDEMALNAVSVETVVLSDDVPIEWRTAEDDVTITLDRGHYSGADQVILTERNGVPVAVLVGGPNNGMAIGEDDPVPHGIADDPLPWITENARQMVASALSVGRPKFAEYQLPGPMTNYREVLLTLPSGRDVFEPKAKAVAEKYGFGLNNASRRDLEQAGATKEELAAFGRWMFPAEGGYKEFRSGHFPGVANLVAHLRMNDRVDADGRKTLFVEEVQSDYSIAVRKAAEEKAFLKDKLVPGTDEFKKRANELAKNPEALGLPKLPFQNSWTTLAMKKALRMAVDGGYASLSWVTGEQTQDRYDLSKSISKIEYESVSDPADTYEIAAYDLSGKEVFREDEVNIGRVEELVGKDIAKKIEAGEGEALKDQPYRNWRVLSGLELKTGGEWAKNLYDERIPNELNRYVKKWGGRVGEATINGENQRSLTITPAIREGVSLGQPLFSRKKIDAAGSLVGSKFTLPPETSAQKAQRFIQKESNRFQVVQDAVAKQGGKVDESSNFAEAVDRYPGRLAAAMKDAQESIIEPFAKRIHEAGTTTDEVSLLAYAEHAPERNAEIAKINPRFPNDGTPGKSGSGMTDQEAADIIKQVKSMPNAAEMFRLSEELRDITSQNLDNLVAGGEMEQTQADEYRDKYKFYVPLKGFELVDESGMTQPTGKGLSTGASLGFRAMGRESRAGQIFEHTIQDYENGLMLSEKAVVAKTLRNFIKANPDDALWTIDNAPKKPRLEKGGSLYQIIAGGNLIAETASKDFADKQVQALLPTDPTAYVAEVKPSPKGLVKWRDSPFDPEEEIRFIENGKPVRIQLSDAGMVRSYNRLWHSGVSDGLTLLNSYNGWLRQMYTQKNPAWFVMNAQKDILSVMPYVTGEAGIKTALKIPGNIPGAFKAAWAFHHNKTAGAKWNALIEQFKAAGGYTGFAFVGDIEAQTSRLNGAIARHTGWDEALGKFKGKSIKAGVSAVGAKVMNTAFFSWIEAMNSTFENMTRLAVFKSAIDSGMTPNEAGKLAKNASTNFNTRGEWGPNINAVWLFANAGIQGTRNVGHALMFSPHKEQVWALMGGLVALGMMAGLMSDDDDDLLDDQLRSRTLVFKVGDAQLSLPMPYGFGFFSGFGQLAAQAMKHPEKRDNIALKMATLAFDHFSPIGDPLSGEADLKNAVNVMPTSIKPVLNVATNVSPFGGGPLFPESPYDETKPDSTKMWASTRGTGYDKTAQWINALTGGDQYKAGAISVSPETLKLSVSTLFGGAGKLASDLASLPFDVSSETLAPSKIPILKNYIREIDQKAYLGRFYDQAQEAQDAYTIWRRYLKAGMVDEATSYKQGESAMISMGGMVSAYRKQIKLLRDMESMTVNSDLSPTEKNLRLAKTNASIVQITSAFNDRLKSFH